MVSVDRLLAPFALAPWLTGDRAGAWLKILATMSVVLSAGWIVLARNGLDLTGKPLGTDFISFWSAARMVVQGAPPEAVYNPQLHAAVQQAAFPGADVGYTPFPYPPSFLLICLPLGLLPYFPSLLAWMAVTGFGYWRTVTAWLGSTRSSATAILAFPAVLVNLGNGQNAFLTTTLFGCGALALQRRPFLGGACLGLLIFKPHLGLLIPIALLAARQWRAIVGASVAAAGLMGAATLVFGLQAWRGFLGIVPQTQAVLEGRLMESGLLQSVFGALRVWRAPLAASYAVQIAVSLCVAAAVAWFAFRHPRSRAIGPVLIAGSLLASPYLLDYDLVLSAIPLAWLFSETRGGKFLPWDRIILLAAYVLPRLSRSAALLGLPLTPLVLIALLLVTLRRAWLNESDPLMAADGPDLLTERPKKERAAFATLS